MATIPSISLIPSGYKAGKVYSVLPTDGSADFDFSRNTTTTRINKDGLIENVGNNVPRLDYEGGGCPSLLLEPQSTNLIAQSEAFSNSYWTKSGASVVGGFSAPSVNSPLGAIYLVEDSSNGNHSISSNPLLNVFDATTSIFVKSNGSNYFVIRSNSSGGAYLNCTFNLITGVNTYNGMTKGFEIKSISNGWYRISSTNRSSATAYRDLSFNLSQSDVLNNNLPSHQGDGTSGVYIFGAQIEAQSYATSYIPTSGSAQTRLAETANGAGNASTFNDSEGVLMLDISALADDSSYKTITVNDNGTSDRIQISINSNDIYIGVIDNGVTQVFDSVSVADITNFNKVAVSYILNNCQLWINGFKVFTDTSASMPSGLSQINFDKGDGGDDFYGKTKQIQYYNTALTDLELETLTSYTSFNAMALAQNYTI